MSKFLLSFLLFIASILNVYLPQRNFITESAVKKANSISFSSEEYINVSNKIRFLNLQSFDIKLSDFINQEKMTFNFEFTKDITYFAAYHVFVLNDEKELVLTITQGSLGINDEDIEVSCELNLEDIKEIGNNFYLRIASTDVLDTPYSVIVDYFDIPLSNVWNLKMEDTAIEFVVEINYNMTRLKIVRERFEILNLEKVHNIDVYFKLELTPISVTYSSKKRNASYDMDTFIYVYDELNLFNSAFIDDDNYLGYARASCFFQSTYNNTKKYLTLNSIYSIDLATRLMSSSRNQFSSSFRDSNAIYFPKNYYNEFKDTKMKLRFIDFGQASAIIEYDFSLHFAEVFISDTYIVVGEDGRKDWGGSMEEVMIE